MKTIPVKAMRTMFIAMDAISAAVLLCFAMRGPIAHHMGYDSLAWKSFSVLARSLLLIIPAVLAIYFICSDRQRILRFERNNRLQDVSSMFLMGMWMLLAAGFLMVSWIVSVSKGLD
jgi:hypothetical protein